MEFVIVLAILTLVVVVVGAPLRREAIARRARGVEGLEQRRALEDAAAEEAHAATALAELEAAREAKYREIRDAELDHRTGKLSDADYQAVDEGLRAEAIEILRAIDRVREAPGATIGQR